MTDINMDTTIKRLIRLNVELEGALRVISERSSAEALDSVREKFSEMESLFASLNVPAAPDEPTPELKSEAKLEPESKPENTEIKYAEAENGESEPMDEPDDASVPRCGKIVETDAEAEKAAKSPIAVDDSSLKSDIRKAFTLNDKFRFRRELFGNNDAELNDTLDLIATMHSMDEAEEYAYEDLAWDRDDEAVADFMAIISNFFNLRK